MTHDIGSIFSAHRLVPGEMDYKLQEGGRDGHWLTLGFFPPSKLEEAQNTLDRIEALKKEKQAIIDKAYRRKP